MNLDEQIAELNIRIRNNPKDIESRRALGDMLLPLALDGWPAEGQALDLKLYRSFLARVALPIAEVLEEVKTTEVADFFFRLFGALNWVGEHVKASQFALKAVQMKEEIALAHPLAKTGIRFFQKRTGIRTQFGHLVTEPEAFVRTGILGWREPMTGILLMPEQKCANPDLLRYWSKHICIITDSEICRRLEPLAHTLEYCSDWLKVPNLGRLFAPSWGPALITAWEEKRYPPPLTLDPRQKERGWKILESLGVSRDTWFVITHVRYAVTHFTDQVATRNADITTYFDAYREIVERGGVVLRLGNSAMPKLPQMSGVIDLAHGEQHPGWFDLFLASECRFMLGSSSGPCSLSALFGRPLVISNVAAHCFPVSLNDIFLPKLYREKASRRLLSFSESHVSQFRYLFNSAVLAEYGVELVDNEPDDLRNATREMLARLDGTVVYTEDDKYLQHCADALASSLEGYPMKCSLARDFARKHRALIVG